MQTTMQTSGYSQENTGGKAYFDQLQGLRCIACLIVIADHTNFFGMSGHGGLSVAFFFVLSGFLLVKPQIPDGEDAVCSTPPLGILRFYKKKYLHLVPAFYVILIIHAFLSGQYQSLAGNLTFRECMGAYWYIQQYVFILLLVPFIIIVIHILKRRLKLNNYLIAILLLVMAYLCKKLLTRDVFYLVGNGKHQALRLGLLLVGMSMGYFYKAKPLLVSSRFVSLLPDAISAIILALSVLSSNRFISILCPNLLPSYFEWTKDFECALISAVLIWIVVVNSNGIISRILKTRPMVLIGGLSYLIYIIHPILLDYVTAPYASKLFLRIVLLSICISFTYQAISRHIRTLWADYRSRRF